MDFVFPEWLKDAPWIVVTGFIVVVILGFVSRALLPQIALLLKAQSDLLERQERQAEKEYRRAAEERQWYEQTLMPMMNRASEAMQQVMSITASAYETKLEAVKFETDQKLRLMMEARDRERDELRGRVAGLEKAVTERDQAIIRQQAEIDRLTEDHKRVLDQLKRAEQRIGDLEEDNAQKDARIVDLKEALEKRMQELEKTNGQLQATIAERDDFKRQLVEVRARLVELEKHEKKDAP